MLNDCKFIGHLGGDAEINRMPNNSLVARFSLAVNDSYKDSKGNKVDKTTWITCKIWGKYVEKIGSFLTKGKQVFVQGKCTMSKYKDRNGIERTGVYFSISKVVLLGSSSKNNQAINSDVEDVIPA
jgi:single-strand DNA-binding protein